MRALHSNVEGLSIIIKESDEDSDEVGNYDEYCVPVMKTKHSKGGSYLKCKCKSNTKSNVKLPTQKKMCTCQKKVQKSNINNERKLVFAPNGFQNKQPNSALEKRQPIHYRCCCRDLNSSTVRRKYQTENSTKVNRESQTDFEMRKPCRRNKNCRQSTNSTEVNREPQTDFEIKKTCCRNKTCQRSPSTPGQDELWKLVRPDGTEVAIGYLKKVNKNNISEHVLRKTDSDEGTSRTVESHEEILGLKNDITNRDKLYQEYKCLLEKSNFDPYLFSPREVNIPLTPSLESESVEDRYTLPSEVILNKKIVGEGTNTGETKQVGLNTNNLPRFNCTPKDINSFPSPSEASPFWNSFSKAESKHSETEKHRSSLKPDYKTRTLISSRDAAFQCDASLDSVQLMTVSPRDKPLEPVKGTDLSPSTQQMSTQTQFDCKTLCKISVDTQTETMSNIETLSLRPTSSSMCRPSNSISVSDDNGDNEPDQSTSQNTNQTKPAITQSDINVFSVIVPNNYCISEKIKTLPRVIINTQTLNIDEEITTNSSPRSQITCGTNDASMTGSVQIAEPISPFYVVGTKGNVANTCVEEASQSKEVNVVGRISEGTISLREEEIGCMSLSEVTEHLTAHSEHAGLLRIILSEILNGSKSTSDV